MIDFEQHLRAELETWLPGDTEKINNIVSGFTMRWTLDAMKQTWEGVQGEDQAE